MENPVMPADFSYYGRSQWRGAYLIMALAITIFLPFSDRKPLTICLAIILVAALLYISHEKKIQVDQNGIISTTLYLGIALHIKCEVVSERKIKVIRSPVSEKYDREPLFILKIEGGSVIFLPTGIERSMPDLIQALNKNGGRTEIM